MVAVGNVVTIHQLNAQPSTTIVLADSEIVFSLSAGQRVKGVLYFPYYNSGAGGLNAQIVVDNAPTYYLISPHPIQNLTNTLVPFTGVGPSALQAWTVDFDIIAALATPVRVQFAQLVLDALNPTYFLTGGYVRLFYY